MSWLFVPGMEESSLGSNSSLDLPPMPSATWNGKLLRQRSWPRVWAKVFLTPLRSTLTSEPSTVRSGLESWILRQRERRASLSQQPLEAERSQKTSFLTLCGSQPSAYPHSFSSKTSEEAGIGWNSFVKNCGVKDTSRPQFSKLPPPRWVRRMSGTEGGFLPTPTAKANALAPSMRKWPAYALLQDLFPGVTNLPAAWCEWMMAIPQGWTAIGVGSVEMESFRSWLQGHSPTSLGQSNNDA